MKENSCKGLETMPEDLLTAQEAADYLKLKKATVYEMVKRGELPSVKVGKRLRISRAALEALAGTARSEAGRMDRPERGRSRSSIVLCGQDPSLDLIANAVTAQPGNGSVVLRSYAGSYNSLNMLYQGRVDIATAHLWDEESRSYNLPYLRKLLPGLEIQAVRLFGRTMGMYVQAGNPKGITGLDDLRRRDIRLVNRERGSGTRVFLDEKRKALGISVRHLSGYGREETTHMTVAGAVARGEGDLGFGAEAAARQVQGVAFLPLQLEWYDMVLLRERREERPFQAVMDYVCSQAFQRELDQTGAYDLSQTGRVFEL